MSTQHEEITNPADIEALMRDDGPALPKPPTRPHLLRHGEPVVPDFLRRGSTSGTMQVEVDGQLPVIILLRALSAHGISLINFRDRLVLTQRPDDFR